MLRNIQKIADERDLCNGCTACVASCPLGCIRMFPDSEGFLYPEVDFSVCSQCGKCVETCPALMKLQPHAPLSVYAVLNKNQEIRIESSSGGIFTLLAGAVIADGGIVYGAGWSDDLRVVHKSVETEDELSGLRGSKYVQSEMDNIYKELRIQLLQGRRALFSGTPCQVAGLKSFLQQGYSNLLCVDMICLGVPSPLVFKLYKQSLEARYGSKAKKISFRRKDFGWKKFALAVSFEKQVEYLETLETDMFLLGYHNGLYTRPSCHQCLFRELRSGSDITLADYWNVHHSFPELDDDLGVSMVLVNTQAGQTVYAALESQIKSLKSDYSDVLRWNPAVYRSWPSHKKRNSFFRKLKNANLSLLIKKSLTPSIFRRILARF